MHEPHLAINKSISPLALSFEEASNPTQFLSQIQSAAEQKVLEDIASAASAPLKVALSAAKFATERGEIVVRFPGGVPRGARLMRDKLGRQIPKLVNGKTNKVIGNARVVGKGTKLAASAALVIVEAAHWISGHDNAKRLKKIERGVAKLVHAQQTELKARLEAIYRYAREIAGGDHPSLSSMEQAELGRLCLDLMQLRAQWREGFLYELDQIDPAKADWFAFNKKENLQKHRHKRAKQAEEVLEAVQWMHFSLLLQMALAEMANRADRFVSITLKDESDAWARLFDRAQSRAKQIAGCDSSIPEEWKGILGHIEGLATVWRTRSLPPKRRKRSSG